MNDEKILPVEEMLAYEEFTDRVEILPCTPPDLVTVGGIVLDGEGTVITTEGFYIRKKFVEGISERSADNQSRE